MRLPLQRRQAGPLRLTAWSDATPERGRASVAGDDPTESWYRIGEQPCPHMVGDGQESRVTDPLAVHGGDVRGLVPHDVIRGRLILRLVGDGAEGVAQGVEVSMSGDA